jgi:hypothetical protein
MLCLSEEESKKFKEYQIECSQLQQKYTQSLIECNQSTIDTIRNNPFVDVNELKLIEEYNKLIVEHKKVAGDYNNLITQYNQVSDQYNELVFTATALKIVLGITCFIFFIKWLIKVERKMSKRDLTRTTKLTPITFAKRTNPKKGDRF